MRGMSFSWGGVGNGGPPKCRIYNKYSIFLHSTTKNEQKSPSTTNPIILQSTTDFSEILQHSIQYIILLYFHESMLLISPKIQKFYFKILFTGSKFKTRYTE